LPNVAQGDWIFDGDRSGVARERLYAVAADLIARDGFEAFTVDALAARAHCSRATIYRHVGGKRQLRDAVLARSSARIVDVVRASVKDLTGAERVITAIEVAVTQIRSDPAGQLFVESAAGTRGSEWLAGSAEVTGLANELAGLSGDDPIAARWIVRLVLSLLFLPDKDAHAERQMLRRYVAPAFVGAAAAP
jgi:AcrR family transcriptional regulator